MTQTTLRDFVALDFETSNFQRNSACSVALVRVRDGAIVDERHDLIRPPSSQFTLSHIHGIRWSDVRNAPTFQDLWPSLLQFIDGTECLIAHNAPFDRSVLNACCEHAALPPSPLSFLCTVQVARNVWTLPKNNLPALCTFLNLPLKHHDALSDARACANIAIAAQRTRPGVLLEKLHAPPKPKRKRRSRRSKNELLLKSLLK